MTERMKDGCVGGVACARRQRMRRIARPGFRSVRETMRRRVSTVRWWCHFDEEAEEDEEGGGWFGEGVVTIRGGLVLGVVILFIFFFSVFFLLCFSSVW